MAFEEYENTFPGNWAKVIDQYANLNTQYIRYAGDTTLWYGEMTNTGLLATAAWMAGAPAISEVRELKRVYNDRPGRPGPSTGRVDLFFYPDGLEGHWVETKILARPIDISRRPRNHRVIAGLDDRMQSALRDARQCHEVSRANQGVAVALCLIPFVLNCCYYQRGPGRIKDRVARAQVSVDLIRNYVGDSDLSWAAYFDTQNIQVRDEDDRRPFGFGVVGHFQRFDGP